MIIIIITIKTDETNSSMLFGVKWIGVRHFSWKKRERERKYLCQSSAENLGKKTERTIKRKKGKYIRKRQNKMIE